MSIELQLAVIALGILLVAFFSAAETAVISINRVRLHTLVEAGDARASLILKLLEHPQRLTSTILLGSTIGILTACAMATLLAVDTLGVSSVGIVVLAMTVLVLILGEIVPKSLAASYAEGTAMLLSGPLKVFVFLLSPIVSLVILLISPLLRTMGADARLRPRYTMAELRTLVEIGTEQGELEQQETKLIQSAFAFEETYATQIITPRVDVVCVPINSTVKETLEKMVEEEFSRLPVYEDNIDNIVGVINVKDLLKVHYEYTRAHKDASDLPIRHYIRPIFHVPENKKVDELLRDMQRHRMPMAIVSDEYGGTVGLVTLEDVIEEIVGEIRDEHDIDELPMYHIIDENTMVVDGKMGIEELNELLGTSLPREDYETLGGLVFSALGRVPQVGDNVVADTLKLEVERMDGIRIGNIRVEKLKPANGTSDLSTLEEQQSPAAREQS